MAELISINYGTDVIDDETKVTQGFFTGNLGSLAADNLTTSSLSSTQKNYYYDMQYSSEDQFSVTFGHIGGSGSGAVQETKAIYMHFKNLLVNASDIASTSSNGFKFTGLFPTSGSASSSLSESAGGMGIRGVIENDSDYEDFMYFIVADRARMKDKINAKNWTIAFSGSRGIAGGGDITEGGSGSSKTLKLTDDSATVMGEATPAGVRYNVVSGSDGTIVAASSSKYYGWIYPDMGIVALRGNLLSASLPGTAASVTSSWIGVTADIGQGGGFAPELTTDGTADNALKLGNSMRMAEQKFRSEEMQKSKSYFIRAFANDMNFSNNPTFTSGSDRRLRHSDMIGYPHTFITSVGLYQQGSSGPELVAIGKLSGPVQKNYGTEATIKVKLTY